MAAVAEIALLVGGDRLLRECLSQLLKPVFPVITTATSLAEIVQDGQSRTAHLATTIVLCLGWPQSSHAEAEAFSKLKAIAPGMTTVVLATERDSQAALADAVRSGVDGVLLRDTSMEVLLKSLAAIQAGAKVCSTQLIALALSQAGASGMMPDTPAGQEFTPRQVDILSGLAAGQSNKMIARELGVSEATIKVQVRSILRKLRVENRTQAAICAQQLATSQWSPQAGRRADLASAVTLSRA